MLKKFVAVALALVPAIAGASIISAPNNTPHAGEQSLWEIVNNVYGTSFTSNGDMQFAQIGDEIYTGGFSATAQAVYAGNTQTFGWYESVLPGAISSTNPLFTATGSGYAVTGAGQFTAAGAFGLYLTTTNGGSNTWYSETARNSDARDHQALYDLALLTGDASYAGSYLSAWEDLTRSKWDKDYNDLVVQLDTNVVPEPATMTLLGLGLVGLAARRMRKKA